MRILDIQLRRSRTRDAETLPAHSLTRNDVADRANRDADAAGFVPEGAEGDNLRWLQVMFGVEIG